MRLKRARRCTAPAPLSVREHGNSRMPRPKSDDSKEMAPRPRRRGASRGCERPGETSSSIVAQSLYSQTVPAARVRDQRRRRCAWTMRCARTSPSQLCAAPLLRPAPENTVRNPCARYDVPRGCVAGKGATTKGERCSRSAGERVSRSASPGASATPHAVQSAGAADCATGTCDSPASSVGAASQRPVAGTRRVRVHDKVHEVATSFV